MRLLVVILGIVAVIEGFLLGFSQKSKQEPTQQCTHILQLASPNVAIENIAKSTICTVEAPKVLRYTAISATPWINNPFTVEEKNVMAAHIHHFQDWNLNEADTRVVCKLLLDRKAILLETLHVASEMNETVNSALLQEVLKKNDEQLCSILGENGVAKLRNNTSGSSLLSFEEYLRARIR